MGPAAGGADAFLTGAAGAAITTAGAGEVLAAGAAAGFAGALDLTTGFGAGFAGGLATGADALACFGLPVVLTGPFDAAFLTGRFCFFLGCGFLAKAGLAFFFGAGLGGVFFLPTGLDLARAAGLAFPWAAFFLVLLDLLTV